MAIKYYKDGEWKIFPGTIGPAGKDAFQIAQEGGYKGTREEYTSSLVNLPELSKQVEANTQAIENLDLGVKFEKVDVLPSVGNDTTIYLVPVTGGSGENSYSEYLYTNGAWENIGSHTVNLAGYATEQWVEDNYQTKGEYLTAIPEEYITLSELEAKDYATKSDLNGVTPDLSGVYTKDEIDAKGFLTEIPAEYVTETELSNKNYALKSDVPTDFYTKGEVDQKISEVQSGSANLANYYTKAESDEKYYGVVGSNETLTVEGSLEVYGDLQVTSDIEANNVTSVEFVEDGTKLSEKYALKTDVPSDYVSNSVFENYKTTVADSYYDTTETKRVIALTHDEYNSITEKDENALYFIVDDEGNLVTNTVDGDLTVTGSVEVGGNMKATTLYENGVSLADKYLLSSTSEMFAPNNKYYTDVVNIGMPGICDLTETSIGSVDVDSIKVTKNEPSALIITNYESDVVFGSMYAKSFGSEDANLTSGYKCYAITYVNDNLALVNFAHYV